jgi:hypothetical protein
MFAQDAGDPRVRGPLAGMKLILQPLRPVGEMHPGIGEPEQSHSVLGGSSVFGQLKAVKRVDPVFGFFRHGGYVRWRTYNCIKNRFVPSGLINS